MWFGLAWWRQSWVFTTLNRTGSSLHHIKNSSKYANICKHLKNLPQSHCKLAWFMIGGALSSSWGFLSLCLPVTALRGTNEKEFLNSSFISGQLVPWIYCFICQYSSKQFSSITFSCWKCHFTVSSRPICTHTFTRMNIWIRHVHSHKVSEQTLFQEFDLTHSACNSCNGSTALMHPLTTTLTSFGFEPVLGEVT